MLIIFFNYVDLKQIDWQTFLQQKWVYLEPAENISLGSTAMSSHVQVPIRQKES